MEKTKLQELRIVDNFYQTSSFFPMPTLLVGTLCDDLTTSFGTYSLCFPFYIAGKENYTMLLHCRNSSNTCKNILKRGKASLNFVPAKKKILKECVSLGFPGDSPKEKMKNFSLTVSDGLMQAENPKDRFPKIIEESFQVFECSWLREIDGADKDRVREQYLPPFHICNGITSEQGAHFILKIDKILMREKYRKAIVNGVRKKDFPPVPVDYGYRDSQNFWFCGKKEPYAEKVQAKAVDVESVMYAANRIDPKVRFTKEACMCMVHVPRVFLNAALKGCVIWAKEHNVQLVTKEHMKIINDKRAAEKRK